MTSHFYISYAGNKRREMNEIEPFIDLKGIKTIVEPFCGSSAFSFHIYDKINKDLKFHFNDLDKDLISLLNEIKTNGKDNIYNNLIKYKDINKEDYNKYSKELKTNEIVEDRLSKWLLINVYYCIRAGLFPINKPFPRLTSLKTEMKFDKLLDIAKVTNHDFRITCDKYKNDKTAFLFIDPPYVNSCNDFYSDSSCLDDVDKFYEYLIELLKTSKCKIMMVVNNALLMRLLFKDFIKHKYGKTYEATKRKVEHIIITNY